MFMIFKALIRGTVMVPLTVAAYGAVMIGLAWVTAVETVFSARRLVGIMPKTPLPMRRDISSAPPPIQTL